MTHNTREGQPTESQALPHENIIQKCWKPDCRKVATCRDGSGWEWCDGHVDQEKTGSVLHTAQEYYDVDYYTALLKERIHHQLQKARQNWLRSEIEKLEGEISNVDHTIQCIKGHSENHNNCIRSLDGHKKTYNTALTSIITRYKEELKVLESK